MTTTENSLKATLFKLTLDSLPDGILLIDSDRNVIYHNDRFRMIWGIPDEILKSGNSRELVRFVSRQVADPDRFISQVERVYTSEEAYEDELELKDRRVIRRRSSSFHDQFFGRARIWIFSDISEAKRAEDAIRRYRHQLEETIAERTAELIRKQEELSESHEKYQSLSDASFEGIIISEKGIIIEANATLIRMFGYPIDEVIGMEVARLAPPAEREHVRKQILSGSEKPYASMGKTRDGIEFPVEVHGRMFEYRGKKVRVTAIRDLTEQREAEEKIRVLSGLLPICSSCKKIRDDRGYWNRIESYIEQHSDAKFSHSICDNCAQKLYGHEVWYQHQGQNDQNDK